MKLPESLKPSRLFAKDRRGVALITVLTVMALTTILVLTFFTLATSEHRASNTYSQGLQAQQVAEQAVNLVIAQIREATVRLESQPNRVWSSQPGAIRTWDTKGNKEDAYKLYSDDVMVTRNWAEFLADFSDARNWSSKPDHFVDLNEPVIRGRKVYYPIVHPAASTIPTWPKEFGGDKNGVEGFRYNEDGLMLTDAGPLGSEAAKLSGAGAHVAMPVRWLYQLADGTIGVISESSSGGAEGPAHKFSAISGAGTPSAQNPMVARFAFWADDETAKLNMNVHAGGLAWDVPKAGGELDMAMGKFQPAQKEWQRYPGHPATTHLIPALAPGVLDIVNDRDAMEMLFKVVPRVVGGGSESGTRVIDTRNKAEENGLVADSDPLFPTLDDVALMTKSYAALGRKAPPGISSRVRAHHEFPNANGDPIEYDELSEYLERAKFFITVNSRAPETNLFNKPRISMWPIYNADYNNQQEYVKYLTAFDRLIQFCSSVGEAPNGTKYPRNEYIFRREKHDSATYDYGSIPRNKDLIGYLNQMMDSDFPGYGESFSDKYGKENTAQLVTMIFDYIRSTNLHDDTLFADDFEEAFARENTTQHYTYTNPRDYFEKGFGLKGHGQVTPIMIVDEKTGVETKGMGRFYSLSGADIHVTSVGEPGFRPNSMYPGVTEYNRPGFVEPPSGNLYTNLPPLHKKARDAGRGNPISVNGTSIVNDPRAPGPKQEWPTWLKDLEVSALGIDPPPPVGGPVPAGTQPNPAVLGEVEAAFKPEQWNWQLAFMDPGYRAEVLANPTANKFNPDKITKAGNELMRLKNGERLVQAAFLFNMFCPSIGWGSINPDMEIEILRESGMTFPSKDQGDVGFLGFEATGFADADGPNRFIWATNWAKPHRQGGARSWGGLLSFGYMMSARQPLQENRGARHAWWQLQRSGATLNESIRCRLTPMDRGYDQILNGLNAVAERNFGMNDRTNIAQAYRYDLVTQPFVINDQTLDFAGGTVRFLVRNGGEHTEGTARDSVTPDTVQDVLIDFPRFSVPAPVMTSGFSGWINEFGSLSHDSGNAVELASLTADPGNPLGTSQSKATRAPGKGRTPVGPGVRSMQGRMALVTNHWDSGATYIRDGDVVQSIAIQHGDMRVAAARRTIKPEDQIFGPHRKYGKERMAHSLTNSAGGPLTGYNPASPDNKPYLLVPDLPNNGNPPYRGVVPLAIAGDKRSEEIQMYGDFDNGAGTMVDGPYINKPDEGNVHSLKTRFTQEILDFWEQRRNYGEFPYFSNPDIAEAGGPAYFSPNRIISGPGMLGSLPSALFSKPPKPWQTLLFRPNVVGNKYVSHPGALNPPDHLIMDLFWMPVVEPYAISEPLSTAGKVNMNFEIVPFLHVHRDTALRGVFRSEMMLCVPNKWHQSYKHDHGRGKNYHWRDNPYGGELQGKRLRSVILENDTLVQFTKRKFREGEDIFKSATEICDIHLIPQEISERLGTGGKGSVGSYTPKVNGQSGMVPEMSGGKYWRDHALVGDNSRERPYTNIQTRLTTKSNTFQVHYRAQVLKQARRETDEEYAEWRPYVDTVQAEYRGSSTVERYINPNEKLVDFAVFPKETVDKFYRFRVINPRRFAP